MDNRLPAAVLLFSAMLISAPASAGAGETMANAMLRMMEAMGFLGDKDLPFNPAPYMIPGAGGLSQMPWAQVPWTQMPGYSVFANPGQTFAQDGIMGQLPGGKMMQQWWPGVSATALDGVWEGRDGGLMIILGQRFRLQAARGGHIEGLIQRRSDRIALYEPETGTARAYEIAEQAGRMVLRDDEGNTYLYRRLWLDDNPYSALPSD